MCVMSVLIVRYVSFVVLLSLTYELYLFLSDVCEFILQLVKLVLWCLHFAGLLDLPRFLTFCFCTCRSSQSALIGWREN